VVLRIAYAVLVFIVFGVVAVAMGRSAVRDIREGHDNRDGVSLVGGIQALVPTIAAGAAAIACPVLILVRE
jgi:membrane protein implicated in regulation of membrane protease activity